MSDTLMTDFSSYCRVCLQLPEVDQILDLTTIYDEDEQLSYYDCFRICTAIDLQANNKMDPHNICISCGLELQMVYDFFKKIDESKKFLEQLRHQQQQQLQQNEHEESLNNIEASKVELQPEQHIVELEVESLSETPLSASTEDVEVIDCHIEVEEEHLDMDDYQEVEEIEDDNDDGKWTTKFLITEFGDEKCYRKEDNDNEKLTISNKNIITKELTTTPCVCEICGHKCPTRRLLYSHRHRKHRKKSNPFQCEKCAKCFNTREQFTRHQKRLSCIAYPEFDCEYCGKKCIGKANYNIHLRFHKKLYPFVCHLCGRSYALANHLTQHIKTKHENQRYVCSEPGCNKMYLTTQSLKEHAYTHLRTMPYKCEYCVRLFPSKGRLRFHIRKAHDLTPTLDQLERMMIGAEIDLKANLQTVPIIEKKIKI